MITIAIILLTGGVSLIAFSQRDVFSKLLLNPYQVIHSKQYYRILSHTLVHANWGHLIFNMLTLYFFGDFAEDAYRYYFGLKGGYYFVSLYVLAAILSSLPSVFKHKNNFAYNAVGASGAVSAILFTSILLNPLGKIYLFMIPIGIPGFIFGILYLVYSAYMSKRNTDNIGHDAHFWGAIVGLGFPLMINYHLIYVFLDQIKQYLP